MSEFELSIQEEIELVDFERPHVVILGSGASIATWLEGDKFGEELPDMNGLYHILDLEELLKEHDLEFETINFESIYSDLESLGNYPKLIEEINRRTRQYFDQINLPEFPTLYDHLVLSLRKKDIIATFNWDPLLYQACQRNSHFTEMPYVAYLHGNVTIGYCEKDKRKGHINSSCSVCGEDFEPTKLLYPVKTKDYNSDPYISTEWSVLQSKIESAYIITIFGYSAPDTDVEAIELLENAWGDPQKRNLEETELINTEDEDNLLNKWNNFIHSHHYQIYEDFYNSWIANHPRRSCEIMWQQLMNTKFVKNHTIPKDLPFDELYEWYEPLINAE